MLVLADEYHIITDIKLVLLSARYVERRGCYCYRWQTPQIACDQCRRIGQCLQGDFSDVTKYTVVTTNETYYQIGITQKRVYLFWDDAIISATIDYYDILRGANLAGCLASPIKFADKARIKRSMAQKYALLQHVLSQRDVSMLILLIMLTIN